MSAGDEMKRLKLLMLILFILVVTAACRSNSGTGTEQGKEPESATDVPVLKVIADSPGSVALFQKKEKEIEEKFGVQLEYRYPDRLTDNMEDFLAATDETFDIIVLFPGKVPMYVERDILLPLDSYIKADPSIKDVLPFYRQLYMNYAGHDYGMAYDGDTHLLFYRKDLFARFNDEYRQQFGKDLKAPETWEEYDQIAHFLTRDLDGDGNIDIYGTANLTNDGMRYIWFAERFRSMGGEYFDGEMNPTIANEIGIQALTELANLQSSDAVPPGSMYDWVDLNNAFLMKKVAMVVQWSDTARFSYDEEQSLVKDRVGWALVPGALNQEPRGGAWIGRVLSVCKNSTHQEKAWQVIQYLTSKEVSKSAINSVETINDPFRTSHFDVTGKGPFPTKEINRDFLDTVEKSLANTNSDLMIPGGWEYMQALDRNVGLVLIGKLSPKDGLEKTEAEWREITNSYGRDSQIQFYQQWLRKLEEVRQDEQTE